MRWFQLYSFRDRGLTSAIVDVALAAGFRALVVTADSPVVGKRDRALRSATGTGLSLPIPLVTALAGAETTAADLARLTDASLTWADLSALVERIPIPVVLKGVLSAEDATRACDAGVAGIIVSNHGGRQLDGVPASLDVLPGIVEAVAGRVELLLDGGVRRGTDVVVALALGAKAVLVGRPIVWSLAVGGEEGVRTMLEILREEFALALALSGAPSPERLSAAFIRPALA